MLKEYESIFKRLMIAGDLVITTGAFLIGHYLRRHTEFILGIEGVEQIYPLESYFEILPVFAALWAFSLFTAGTYKPLRGRQVTDLLLSILKASILSTLLFGSYAYLMKFQFISRMLIVLTAWIAWTLLSIERIIILRILYALAKKGHNIQNMLIVGTGKRAQAFIHVIEQHAEWGFKIVGMVDIDPKLVGTSVMGYPVIGMLDELPKLLEEHVVDETVFVVPRGWLGTIENSLLYCELVGKRVSVAVDLFNLKFAKLKQREFYSYPLLTFETTTDKLFALMIKRLLDIIVAVILLTLFSPIMLTAMVIIKTSSKGPAIFKQNRAGLNGRTVTVYKFRTMVIDAEKKLEDLKQQNEMTGPVFKMTHDPRIIRACAWMRKFSVDEFPQLFNVLQGDMSIVGPRPPIPAEVKKYEPWQLRRLSMRPGITCLWQVQGRNKIVKFEEWMNLDLQYIDHWSLWLDFKICLRTIPVVLFGIGGK